MLENTFDEEYFRITRDVVQNGLNVENDLRFEVNSTNKLVFTTNIFKDNKFNVVTEFFTGQTRVPENVSLSVDSVSLISTNPNLVNFTPLKIRLNGKNIVSFGDVDSYVMDSYNLTTRSNRDEIIGQDFNTRLLNENVLSYYWTGRKNFIQEFNVGDLTRGETDVVVSFNSKVYTLKRLSNYYYITTVSTGETIVLFNADINYLDIKTTSNICVGLGVNLVLGRDVLFDATETSGAVIFFETPIGDTFINYYLIQNVCYAVYYGVGGTTVISEYRKSTPDGNFDLVKRYTEAVTFNAPNLLDLVFFTNRAYYLLSTGEVGLIVFGDFNDVSVTTFTFQKLFEVDVKGELSKIFIGGNSFSSLRFNILSQTTRDEVIYNQYDNSGKRLVTNKLTGVLDRMELIKRFNNCGYFVTSDDNNLVIINGSLGTVLKLNLVNNYRFRRLGKIKVDFSNVYLTIAGIATDPIDNRILFLFENKAGTRGTNVYKYSQEFIGSYEFIFNSTSKELSVEILLPEDKSITDLEIFKLSMDVRVRSSLQRLKPNAPKCREGETCKPEEQTTDDLVLCMEDCDQLPEQKDCKDGQCKSREECYRRCNRSLGSAGRVLGYVGEDFNVSDFLNLYTNR